MVPDEMISEIKKRWGEVATELVRRKRLDANIYENVVSNLARFQAPESAQDGPGAAQAPPNEFTENGKGL